MALIPANEIKAQNKANGKGEITICHILGSEQLGGNDMFARVTIPAGCSIGYHEHQHETEWYYLLKGEAVYNDNGVEVPMHAGDLSITPHGEGHALENRSTEPVELIALIVME